jgi:ligand-binding sensor domain-containing protein
MNVFPIALIRLQNLITVLAFSIVMSMNLMALDPTKTINQYVHNTWMRQTGLPAHSINTAIQTHDGFIWFGTSSGLYKFDGVSFKEVSTDPNNQNTHETITTLRETSDSVLWIGTAYNGLRRIKQGIVTQFGVKNGFEDTQVWSLCEYNSSTLLIGTSIGLYKFKNNSFNRIYINPSYITGITKDTFGRVWVGTHGGVRIFNDSTFTNPISLTTKDGLCHDVTSSLFAEKNGSVWIGTYGGLSLYRDGKFITYNQGNGFSNDHVNTINNDQNGNIWVGTQLGISRFSRGIWTSFSTIDGLTDENVISILEDHEKSIWVCTSNGLNQFIDPTITSFTTKEGLANNSLSSVIETNDGTVYFLSTHGANITIRRNNNYSVINSSIGPAFIAHDGSLWMSQSGMLSNIRNGRLKQYTTQNGLPNKWISAIGEDSLSIIVQIDHTGTFRFINGQLKPFLLGNGLPYPKIDYVSCFYYDPKDALWIGTADSLVRIDNGTSRHFTTQDGMAGNWVSSIFKDHKGILWISSPQGGLTRYFSGKFTAYNTNIGLFTDEIYSVLCDDAGDIWLSSPCGIGYIKRKELDDYADKKIISIQTRVYTIADGLKSEECFGGWQPSGWKSKNGNLWFATKKGAVLIDIKTFKQNLLPPQVFVEKVIVDQQIVSSDSVTSIRAGSEKIEFHYTALSFLVPERVLFKYLLEGFDHDWVSAGTRRVAYYTNLPPGKYRFRVMACNNDGIWNQQGAKIDFILEPRYYESYWFSVFVLVIISGIVFGVYRLRIVQLINREQKLKQGIDEAVANMKVLGGLIPICSNCKKIRNDKGFWDNLERYIQEHSEAKFSHGLCPECMVLLYPGIQAKKEKTS